MTKISQLVEEMGARINQTTDAEQELVRALGNIEQPQLRLRIRCRPGEPKGANAECKYLPVLGAQLVQLLNDTGFDACRPAFLGEALKFFIRDQLDLTGHIASCRVQRARGR